MKAGWQGRLAFASGVVLGLVGWLGGSFAASALHAPQWVVIVAAVWPIGVFLLAMLVAVLTLVAHWVAQGSDPDDAW